MSSSSSIKFKGLPPLPTLRDILAMYQLRAKKNLSQNFILNPSLLNKFASLCDLKDKYVVEVGPGPGGITRAALEGGCKEIHVIEKDPRFLPSLQLLKTASGNRLHINMGNCLNYNSSAIFNKEKLRKDWEGDELPDIRLIGNLPFNISLPYFIKLCGWIQTRSNIFSYGRVQCVFTFQHEIAHRLICAPGDPERSRLTIFAQNFVRTEYLHTVPGSAFVPKPDVDVGIVKIIPLKKPFIDLPFPFIEKVVTTSMAMKNKKILHNVARLFPKDVSYDKAHELCEIAGIDETILSTSLTMEDFDRICHSYKFMIEKNPQFKSYMNRSLKSSFSTSIDLNDEMEDTIVRKPTVIVKIPHQ